MSKTLDKVLIVVDMQNDFLSKSGALPLPFDTEILIDKMYGFIEAFKEAGGTVIYTLDNHQKNDVEFGLFPSHCVEGTDGQQLTLKLKDQKKEHSSIDLVKSSFTTPSISADIIANNYKQDIFVVGVCTHICVHDVVAGLVNTAKAHWDYIPKIKLIKELLGDFDEEMSDFALKRMQRLYGVEVLDDMENAWLL